VPAQIDRLVGCRVQVQIGMLAHLSLVEQVLVQVRPQPVQTKVYKVMK